MVGGRSYSAGAPHPIAGQPQVRTLHPPAKVTSVISHQFYDRQTHIPAESLPVATCCRGYVRILFQQEAFGSRDGAVQEMHGNEPEESQGAIPEAQYRLTRCGIVVSNGRRVEWWKDEGAAEASASHAESCDGDVGSPLQHHRLS